MTGTGGQATDENIIQGMAVTVQADRP